MYREFVAEHSCCEMLFVSDVWCFGVMPLMYRSEHCTAIDLIPYLVHKLFEQFIFCTCLKNSNIYFCLEPQMCSLGFCYHWTVSEKLFFPILIVCMLNSPPDTLHAMYA